MSSASINDELRQWHRADQVRAAEQTHAPQWFPLAYVSELTHIPIRTLRSYIDRGLLVAFHPIDGCSVRVRAEDISKLFVQIQPKNVTAQED